MTGPVLAEAGAMELTFRAGVKKKVLPLSPALHQIFPPIISTRCADIVRPSRAPVSLVVVRRPGERFENKFLLVRRDPDRCLEPRI